MSADPALGAGGSPGSDPAPRGRSDGSIHGHARILVVEDSPSARKLMQVLLTRMGVALPELRIAPTVSEALQIFYEWQPQIAFVDLELRPPPDRPPVPPAASAGLPSNGAELVALLRQRDPGLQIIVCSATDPALTPVAPLVRGGQVQAIVKPVVAAQVRDVLGRAAGALASPSITRRPRE